MTSQILPTKLFAPTHRPKLVSRLHLFEQLDAGIRGKLTLVSAPAGYGKSTLLSEWVHKIEFPNAWLSLDDGDNDPVRFWAYFVAALQTIQIPDVSRIGEILLGLLQTSPMPDHENFLGSLISEIAVIPERFVLILDDFHTVTETQIQDGLFYLLENLPSGLSGMHLILSSRSDPPWPLARLRVRGELNEVRSQDLRFTQEEAARFLNDVMGMALSTEDAAALDSRTEGWVAGLQMAALSMRDREDKTGFIEAFTGSHRFVIDYLMEEVLEQQAPEINEFLLKTSLLERLNSNLCDAVISDPSSISSGKKTDVHSLSAGNSQEILESLEQKNLFLISLDDHRNWYRYHHLFADLLQNRLRAIYPDWAPVLHRRASQWYSQAGYVSEAITHACKTEDWDFAANQIERHVVAIIQRGEINLTRHWMDLLPNDVISTRPVLCVAQAWSSAKFASVEMAEKLITQAAAMLSDDPSQDGNLNPKIHQWVSSQIAVLQVVIARARDDSTQRQQELALEALDRVDPISNTAARATLLFRLGLCYLDLGKDEQADQTFSQAYELGRSSGNYYAMHAALYGRMVIAKLGGRLNDMDRIIRQTLEDAIKIDEQERPMVGIEMTMRGVLNYEWNEIDQAENDLSRGLELVEQVGITELLVKGQFAFTCVKIAQEDLSTVPNLIRIAERGHPKLATYAAALQARIELMLAQKGFDSEFEHNAICWAEKQQLTLRGQSTYDWDIQEKLVYARILCRQVHNGELADIKSRLVEVLDFLAEQRQPLQVLGWWGILIELEAVIAIMLRTLGRNADALTTLDHALGLAETQGFVRTFLDEGEPMLELLRQARTQSAHQAYAQKLSTAFAVEASVSREQAGGSDLLEPLSERELQVLRLLNTRLSVPEIADEIHLAPTTVRTHVQNIYQKLNVHGRIEALQRANELGLL